jgi:hypothetical protein
LAVSSEAAFLLLAVDFWDEVAAVLPIEVTVDFPGARVRMLSESIELSMD